MKFINHVDHVAWISRLENIERHVASFSQLLDLTFEPLETYEDLGFSVCLCWEAGLEVVAPHPQTTDSNRSMHDHIDARGEGPYALVFGVRDLAERRERLIRLGYQPSEPWTALGFPWSHKLSLKEMDASQVLNTRIILSEIDYADGTITLA